jgi:spermidine synthase
VARTAGIALLFFGSGAVGLSFEGLWFAQAGLAFGNSIWASSLVLSGFMAGMALGNLAGGKLGGRVRNPLHVYALLELIVAGAGVALVFGLPALGYALAPVVTTLLETAPWFLRVSHFSIAFVLLLLPSAAMGMTLPLLTREVVSEHRNFGRVLGVLYGANTLGATCGVIASHSLVELYGIRGSAFITAGVGLAIAFMAAVLARGTSGAAPEAPSPRASADAVSEANPAWPWLAAAGLAGLALLALEVVWFRFLLLFLNDTPLAFAVVLAIVLAGIGLGSLLGSLLAQRGSVPEHAAYVAYAGGLLGLGGYLIYPSFLQGTLEPQQGLTTVLRIAAPLVLPSSLASGALFPLLGAGLRKAVGADALAAGRLGLANTVGAALGSLLAGFVLLPVLGMERAFFGLFALYGVLALCLPVRRSPSWAWRAGPALLFCAALATFPFGRVRTQYVRTSAGKWLSAEASVVGVREGLTETLVHVVHRNDGYAFADQLVTNSYSMTANGWLARRYMELFVYLPVAVHPRIERALIVGYGMGNTAAALTRTRTIERIDIVDVSRDMLAQSRELQSYSGPSPLDDPRVHVHIDDGRFYLRATEARYDLITGEPPPPIMSGVVSLYTAEYFSLVRSRLAPGGIASYWLPLMNLSAPSARSIIRGFCSAFTDCSLWHGSSRNFMLLGTRDLQGPLDAEHFRAQWGDDVVKRALARVGFELPTQLPALFIGDAEYLSELSADAAPLTDDWPGRMHQPHDPDDHDALIAGFRDIAAARTRYGESELIARLIPQAIREPSVREFETQRVLDALTYREGVQLRDTRLLHELLRKTTLRTPILLLLGSDPDREAVLGRLPPDRAQRPAWLTHRAASRLASRDLKGALELLRELPREQLPMPDLTDYLEYALRMAEQGR